MIKRLKRMMGLCECNKCWNKVYANIGIDFSGTKSINKNLCEKHMHEMLTGSEIKSIVIDFSNSK